tara:strand:- start:188203 stop:190527 length:2325 start_codon:yes stop_codon:yes gene_type:complete
MSKFNPIRNPLSLEVPNREAGSFTIVSIEGSKINLVMSNVNKDKVKDYNVKPEIEDQVCRALKCGWLYNSFQIEELLYVVLDNRLSQHLYEITSSLVSAYKEHSNIQSIINDCSYFTTDCKYTISPFDSDNEGDSMSAFTKPELMNYLFINGIDPAIINDIMITLTRSDNGAGVKLGDQELKIRRIASPVEGALKMIYRLIDLQLGVPMYHFVSTGDVFTFLNTYGDEYVELRDYIVEEFDPSIGEKGESQHIGFLDNDIALECYIANVRMDRRLRPKLGINDASSVLHDKLMRANKPTLQSLLSTKADEFGVVAYGEKGTGMATGGLNIFNWDPEPIDTTRKHFGLSNVNDKDSRFNPRAVIANVSELNSEEEKPMFSPSMYQTSRQFMRSQMFPPHISDRPVSLYDCYVVTESGANKVEHLNGEDYLKYPKDKLIDTAKAMSSGANFKIIQTTNEFLVLIAPNRFIDDLFPVNVTLDYLKGDKSQLNKSVDSYITEYGVGIDQALEKYCILSHRELGDQNFFVKQVGIDGKFIASVCGFDSIFNTLIDFVLKSEPSINVNEIIEPIWDITANAMLTIPYIIDVDGVARVMNNSSGDYHEYFTLGRVVDFKAMGYEKFNLDTVLFDEQVASRITLQKCSQGKMGLHIRTPKSRPEGNVIPALYPSSMTPPKDGKIYHSSRDHRLIAKETLDKPVLTCESYTKWYNLYLLNPDGSVTEINGLDLGEYYDGQAWIDHIYNPEAVRAYCEAKDYYLDEQSYELIVGRWVIESEERY